MAHVQIHLHDREVAVLVDGIDITKSLLAEGVTLDLSEFPIRPATLSGKLVVDEVRVDTEADVNIAGT